ncbi:MAG: hypothetical protein AAFV93_06035 [Chloroflexota bacterium]
MLKVDWGDASRTYIYTKFYPDWTWHEFHNNRLAYRSMIQSVYWRVDYLADFTGISTIPYDFLGHISMAFDMRLPNEGYVIVVGANPKIKRIAEFIIKVVPKAKISVIFANTLEEGRDLVDIDRPSADV